MKQIEYHILQKNHKKLLL